MGVSKYTPQIAADICERLASGESLNSICKDDGMPPEPTVRLWALDDVEGFAANYARAREIGYAHHADILFKLADEARIGVKKTVKADGSIEEVEGDMVERSKLQIDTRKWILSKMLPKTFGDSSRLELSGNVSVADIVREQREKLK